MTWWHLTEKTIAKRRNEARRQNVVEERYCPFGACRHKKEEPARALNRERILSSGVGFETGGSRLTFERERQIDNALASKAIEEEFFSIILFILGQIVHCPGTGSE